MRVISYACNDIHTRKGREEKRSLKFISTKLWIGSHRNGRYFVIDLITSFFVLFCLSTFLNVERIRFLFFSSTYFFTLMNPFAFTMFVGRIFNIQNQMWYSANCLNCYFFRYGNAYLCDDDDYDDRWFTGTCAFQLIFSFFFFFVIRCVHLVLTFYPYWSNK